MAIYNLNKEQIVDKSAKLKSIFCPNDSLNHKAYRNIGLHIVYVLVFVLYVPMWFSFYTK